MIDTGVEVTFVEGAKGTPTEEALIRLLDLRRCLSMDYTGSYKRQAVKIFEDARVYIASADMIEAAKIAANTLLDTPSQELRDVLDDMVYQEPLPFAQYYIGLTTILSFDSDRVFLMGFLGSSSDNVYALYAEKDGLRVKPVTVFWESIPILLFLLQEMKRQEYKPKVDRRTITYRDSRKKLRRQRIPFPYYVIKPRSTESSEDTPRTDPPTAPVEYSHRWDVRAHYRLLTKRGELPISARDQDRLAGRGYAISPGGSFGGRLGKALAVRGCTCGPNEWLAALLVPVKSCIKGPENRPYIPATRLI